MPPQSASAILAGARPSAVLLVDNRRTFGRYARQTVAICTAYMKVPTRADYNADEVAFAFLPLWWLSRSAVTPSATCNEMIGSFDPVSATVVRNEVERLGGGRIAANVNRLVVFQPDSASGSKVAPVVVPLDAMSPTQLDSVMAEWLTYRAGVDIAGVIPPEVTSAIADLPFACRIPVAPLVRELYRRGDQLPVPADQLVSYLLENGAMSIICTYALAQL